MQRGTAAPPRSPARGAPVPAGPAGPGVPLGAPGRHTGLPLAAGSAREQAAALPALGGTPRPANLGRSRRVAANPPLPPRRGGRVGLHPGAVFPPGVVAGEGGGDTTERPAEAGAAGPPSSHPACGLASPQAGGERADGRGKGGGGRGAPDSSGGGDSPRAAHTLR